MSGLDYTRWSAFLSIGSQHFHCDR